ncbi:UDP-galactose transmembrane transporter [Aureococcus anophagefferens]|nr:UDP-galactose transmembrane transporter [Aureococcus anophagefferens]
MSGGGDASEQLTPADGRKYWVLAKSCKPIPVMIMGAFLGKRYPLKKYVNVLVITAGVCLFMLGGSATKPGDDEKGGMTMIIGCVMLFVSLSFDGATGAYEDKIMSNDHETGPILLVLGLTGAMGQVFIFVTIARFGADGKTLLKDGDAADDDDDDEFADAPAPAEAAR